MGHLHNGILLRSKKGENFTICDSMDGPREHLLSEISQSEKDKYFSHMWNLMNKLTSKIKTDSWTAEWQLREGEGGGGGIEGKGKRTHGHGQQCGDCRGEWGMRGLNGDGKNTTHTHTRNNRRRLWVVNTQCKIQMM